MTLTMTRTRTQTALAKLVEVLAKVNGELAFVRELMEEALAPAHREVLLAREAQLERERAALCTTVRQFNPELDPEEVGSSDGWWPGRRPKSRAGMARRYLNKE